MKVTELIQRIRQQAKPTANVCWAFLKKTFSDKKNLVRFGLTAVAMVATAQLLPDERIEYAGFGYTTFIVLSFIAVMISAPHALAKLKLPFNLYSYGIYQWLVGSLLLLFYDWILWYFETAGPLWVMLYCAIISIFNCTIEELLKDDLH
jgi:uncharacterized membrane protein YvlD (DUF360 family)